MTTIQDADHQGMLAFDDALNKSGLVSLTPLQLAAARGVYDLMCKKPNAQFDSLLKDELDQKAGEFRCSLMEKASDDTISEMFKKMVEFNKLIGIQYRSI
jgi:hypothetical protein